MSRATQAQIRRLGTMTKVYLFDMEFIVPPQGIAVPNNLFFRVQSTDVPKNEANQVIDVALSASRIKEPGIQYASQELSLVMVDTVTNEVDDFWTEWEERVKSGVDRDLLEAQIALRMLDGQDRPIRSYAVDGVFPTDYDSVGGQLDGGNSDIVRPAITLAYQSYGKRTNRLDIRI